MSIAPPFCGVHSRPVLGYTHSMRFEFINGVRQAGTDEITLDCGCVLLGPDMDAQPCALGREYALVTIKDLAGEPALSFFDRFEEAS